MYEELVKRLRLAKAVLSRNKDLIALLSDAADAIEELSMRLHGDEAAIAGMKREIERMVVADKTRWIPVSERLPQETQRCIVVSKCGEMAFAIYKDNGFQYPYFFGKVTHWMPLPEPPMEE